MPPPGEYVVNHITVLMLLGGLGSLVFDHAVLSTKTL
jgi:hypothetical protein